MVAVWLLGKKSVSGKGDGEPRQSKGTTNTAAVRHRPVGFRTGNGDGEPRQSKGKGKAGTEVAKSVGVDV